MSPTVPVATLSSFPVTPTPSLPLFPLCFIFVLEVGLSILVISLVASLDFLPNLSQTAFPALFVAAPGPVSPAINSVSLAVTLS